MVSKFGLAIVAAHDFSSAAQLDIICVPGGPGALDVAARPKIIGSDLPEGRNIRLHNP